MKSCSSCKKTKAVTEFYRNKARADGRCNRCKKCDVAYSTDKYRISTMRAQIIANLGGVCILCGFSDPRALQIDHIKGGGKKELATFRGNFRNFYRKVLTGEIDHVQLLCANCNWIKRYENKECSLDR